MGEQRRADHPNSATATERCAHCGRVFAPNRGVGRPGAYCRRSCRQRAYEQRRHAGDQAWSDARLIRMSEQLAMFEDAVDRVQELIDELRADEADERPVELAQLIERLDAAVDLQQGG